MNYVTSKPVCFILTVLAFFLMMIKSQSFAVDVFTVDGERILESAKKWKKHAKALQQVQYEVDLENGLLWQWMLFIDVSKGDFIATLGKLDKNAILNFYDGTLDAKPLLIRGVAKIGGKLYMSNSETAQWTAGEREMVYGMLSRYNYFNLQTCHDFLLGGVTRFKQIQISDDMKRVELTRGDWTIQVVVDADENILSWSVLKEGIIFRKIINEMVDNRSLNIDGLPTIHSFLTFRNDASKDGSLFSTIADQVGIGVFFQLIDDSLIVTHLLKDGPAEQAGVKVGDKVLEINDVPMENKALADVKEVINQNNKATKILIDRKGVPVTLSIQKGRLKILP